ncbi:hypothetical protein [Bradyrhizobium embrapense]
MSETLRRFIGSAMPLASKGELIVVPNPQQHLAEAQRHHEASEGAALSAVEEAIAAGHALIAAKKQTPHGCWDDAVATHCRFTIGTAQKYMRLARREAQFRQLIEKKQSAGLHLTMREAVKHLNELAAEEKPNPPKRKPT